MLTAIRGDGALLVYRAFLCPPGAGGVPHSAAGADTRPLLSST